MSRFKRIKNKTTKKSSVSINEKIFALNKELEKTGMLSEVMRTDNVLSTSTYVPEVPEVTSEVPDPDPDNGITSDDWQQPKGNGADGNPAPDPPTSFPKIWTNAGYLDPTDGLLNKSDLNGDGADLPLYNLPDWQDPADVPDGAVGGVQIEVGGMDPGVRGGYLSSGGFTQTTGNLGGVTFKTHPHLFKPVNYWHPFSVFHPFIDSYWPNNSLGRTPQYQGIVKGTEDGSGGAPMVLFTAYMYIGGGRKTYTSQDPKPPTTKDPIRRGLEDEPIYPGPIENLFNLGKRAFEWLKEKAEAAEKRFDALTAILDAVPPFLNFLTHQVNPNSPWTEENPHPVNINDKEKNEIKSDIEELFNEWGDERVDELNDGAPMTNKEQSQLNNKINSNKANASDDNLEGDIFDAEYNSARMTLNNVGNPRAFEGNIKTNKDGTKTPTAIDDNYVFEGDMDASAPGAPKIIKALINNDKVQNAIKNSGLDYPYRKDAANEPGVDTEVTTKDGKKITINQKEVILNKNMPIRLNLTPGILPPPKVETKESYITEGVGLGLYEPEAMNVDLADIRKGVMPEYPKKPPAEMIDGYHEKSRIRPKPLENEPYVKIAKADLIRNHRLKPSEADEMMDTINMINDHIKNHPEDLIHAQMRYPKDDPRLAELNWKMDQMLEAGEEYLDSNFKENQTLYKRATERTQKNIKLTDPKYVQQKYDELRGTIKPKTTKLVGRLGKHLNKYESKSLFKHVDSKDFKKISERKLEKKKFLEKQEQERLDYINDINGEMDEFRSDWRKEISESDFTNITKGNKVGQTFQHPSGATITLDNTMSDTSEIPTQVTLDLGFGEKITVDAPGENEYGIAGVTKPLDKKVMQKQSVKTAKEINDQLDASEKASESKSARVPIETGDLGYKSTDEILADVGDQWTYDEYMNQMNALSDRYAKIAEPLEKVKLDYIYNKHEDVPIGIVDEIDAITTALHQAQEALHQAWERYNKVPDLPDGGEEPIAKSRRSNYTPQEIAQNRENLKNSIVTTATGVIDGARNLNRVNHALNLAKRENVKSGGSTQITTIPPDSLGGKNNPVETKMHSQSKKAFIKSIDLNSPKDIASQIVDNSADAAQYALGFKAVHSQIPYEDGSQENNVKLNSKGDLEMEDNYAFRPDGYMDTGIAKVAKFFGGTELQKDAATLLDKAGPVGWLAHTLLGDIPDRQDPSVRIKTTITKKELINILGEADYKILVNRMKKEKKKRKVNESNLFSKIKKIKK